MEKTIAELDATLVLNYVEDDIEMTDIIWTEEEPKLDTSFDENQNPKPASKAIVSEGTPSKSKDLIILLDHKVLSPKKLVTTADAGKANGLGANNIGGSEESTVQKPPTPNEAESNGTSFKRSRATEETKDLDVPNSKRIKGIGLETKKINASVVVNHSETPNSEATVAKDLEVRNLDCLVKTTGLEPLKPKRGRPKGFKVKKLKAAVAMTNSYIFKSVEAKQLNPVMKTGDLEPFKPKRGRPKGAKAKPKDTGKSGLEVKQQDAMTKDSASPKPKRGRPKSLGLKKGNISTATIKSLPSEPKKPADSGLNTTQSDAAMETKDVQPPKSKRGRPKSLGLKKVNVSGATKDIQLPVAEETKFIGAVSKQLDPPKESKDIDSSKSDTASAIDLEMKKVKDSMATTELQPSKPKRGRPKSLGVTSSLAINDLKPSKTDGNVIGGIGPNQIGASEETKHSEPSKSKTFKAINTKAKGLTTAVAVNNLKTPETRETDVGNLVAKTLNASVGSKELLKPKRGRPKGLEAKKINALIAMTELRLFKPKQQTVTGAVKVSELSKPKRGRPKGSVAMKVNTFVKAKALDSSIAEETEVKGKASGQLDIPVEMTKGPNKGDLEAQKQDADVEFMGLETSTAKGDNAKGLGTKKVDISLANTKDSDVNMGKKTKNRGVVLKRFDLPVETTNSQPFKRRESKKSDLVPQQIIDLENSRRRKGKAKITTCVTTKAFKSLKIEGPEVRPVEPRQVDDSLENKDLELPKHKGSDRGTIRSESSDGTKEFEFPKPKKIKAVASGVKKLNPFVVIKDTKQAKPEETESRGVDQNELDAPARSREVELPKVNDDEVQNVGRKIMVCTVGTQTIEIPEEDPIPKEAQVKGSGQKTSVNSVETQVLGPPKLKGLGRKSSVSSIKIIDLDAPKANGRDLVVKKPHASVEGKHSESNSLKRGNVSESAERSGQEEDETIKIEEDMPPLLTSNILRECQEIGVKYETVEQIHTEFKYESQSETEEMMKRRRRRNGRPMRGRRRGLNRTDEMKGQTTIDSYFRIVDLEGKLQMHQRNPIFKCDHCLYVGNSKANLERHSLIHRSPDEIMWFHCTECPYKSKYEHQLKSHFLVHRNPDEIEFFPCPHCEVKCSRKHNLTNHIKSIHADRTYSFKCAECKYSTFSKDRLVAHVKKHSKEVHACTLCKFVTKRQEYLESHFKMKHMEEVVRPYPCDTCSYKGKTKRELDRHYDRMHNKEQLHVYQCNHCSFNSIYKKNLEFHLLHMHKNSEGFQKFICGHCQKTFSYKNGLKVHIVRCHLKLSDDDWHKCLECKYKSKDVATLKRHIKRNHGAPRLHCKQCSFATNRQMSMEAHMKTHEFDNEDILKCPECPYRIIQMTSFLYHMKVIHGKPISSKDAEQYYMQDD